jgi:uncharacterized protein YbjQ (UPF0145 family)
MRGSTDSTRVNPESFSQLTKLGLPTPPPQKSKHSPIKHPHKPRKSTIIIMGTGSSTARTSCDSGTLLGASPAGDSMPPPLRKTEKFMIKVPADKKTGDKLSVDIQGRLVNVTIPRGTGDRTLRGGDRFEVTTPGDRNKVLASTLHALPGFSVVECKAMIFASVTQAQSVYGNTLISATTAADVGKSVSLLLQQCQGELLERTTAVGCNAVLGVSSTVANDSSGETGSEKVIIVTMMGTPCIVVSNTASPTATATAIGTQSARASAGAGAGQYNDSNVPILVAEAVVLPFKSSKEEDEFEARC